jgi:hypothetical protein
MTIDYRIAAANELTQFADLRWRLHFDDEPMDDRGAYERFIAEFLGVHEAEWKSNEVKRGFFPVLGILAFSMTGCCCHRRLRFSVLVHSPNVGWLLSVTATALASFGDYSIS